MKTGEMSVYGAGRGGGKSSLEDDLYGFVKNLASLYKSDITPFDDPVANSCWDEVVGDARSIISKINQENL